MGFFHEKDVRCEEDFLVKLHQSCRYLHLIHGHYIRLSSSGLAFKSCNIFDPYLLRNFNVLDYHWIVFDVVPANHPLVVLIWSMDKCGIEISNNLRNLDLYLCKTFFVIWNGVNKSDILIPWVEVGHTAITHSELYVVLPLIFSKNYEHHIIVPVGDKVL